MPPTRGCSFNEAEAVKPRNLQRRQSALEICSAFNEAEAIKPRNPVRCWPQPSPSSSFNEAEAIKPRNLKSSGGGTAEELALQ